MGDFHLFWPNSGDTTRTRNHVLVSYASGGYFIVNPHTNASPHNMPPIPPARSIYDAPRMVVSFMFPRTESFAVELLVHLIDAVRPYAITVCVYDYELDAFVKSGILGRPYLRDVDVAYRHLTTQQIYIPPMPVNHIFAVNGTTLSYGREKDGALSNWCPRLHCRMDCDSIKTIASFLLAAERIYTHLDPLVVTGVFSHLRIPMHRPVYCDPPLPIP